MTKLAAGMINSTALKTNLPVKPYERAFVVSL